MKLSFKSTMLRSLATRKGSMKDMKPGREVLFVFLLVGILGMGGPMAHAASSPITSGLVGEWDAKNIDRLNNTTLFDGNPVTSWANIAPGATDNAASGVTAPPTFIASGFENRPVVRFFSNELTDFAASLNVTGFGLSFFI